MWQVLLAAAAAGSGILAKKLLIDHNAPEPISDSNSDGHQCDVPSHKDSIFPCNEGFPDEKVEAEDEIMGDGSIFMFSSIPSSSEKCAKSSRKKMAGGMRGNLEGSKRNGKGKEGKECGVTGCRKQGWVVDQRKSGKRLYICPKKRRTSKNLAGKCQSCASKGNSPFTWGLSVGMMYMMSAGKAEISKLYNSMDETAKIVQELKAELYRRKTLQNKLGSTGAHANDTELNSQNIDDLQTYGHPRVDEGECASSVLTEDRQIDPLVMDQLEAELEQELEKLPWNCGIEGREDNFEADKLAGEFQPVDDQGMISHPFTGVQPSVLDQKLSHLLIQQQESHILELESKLERTHSKLYEKETELQALKDCVKRLTSISLEDENTEYQMEDEKPNLEEQEINMASQTTRSSVGMKRAMNFRSL